MIMDTLFGDRGKGIRFYYPLRLLKIIDIYMWELRNISGKMARGQFRMPKETAFYNSKVFSWGVS
jgi:hypothetical protein